MATIKPLSVSAKRLAQTIQGSAMAFKLDNILTWDGVTNLAAADLGTKAYVAFRNSAGTLVEFMEIDPSTIASASITILRRGLKYNGDDLTTEVTANKLTWVKGDTIVELGTHLPQLLAHMVTIVGDQSIDGVKTFTSPPVVPTPIGNNDAANKAYVNSVVAGIATTVNLIVPGTAGATIAAGNLIYLDDSTDTWKLCDADTAATVDNVMLGIAQGSGTNGNPIANGILLRGLDANQTSLTAGSIYYASNTAGAISASPGTVEVTIGFAYSTTQLYFNPRFNQQLTEDQQDALAGTSGTPSSTNKFVTADDVSAAAASGKIVRAVGTALPALSAENLTNLPGAKKTMTAGETINGATLPVPVYFNNSDDEFYACDGNDQAKIDFIGFATSNGTDGNPLNVQFNGIVGGFSGLTVGERYWVQDTVGTIGTTRGTYEISVGIAVSATEIFIDRLTDQYIGSQGLSNGSNTITAAVQGLWRKIVVVGSGNNGANTGEVTIFRLGKTSGEHTVEQGGAPSFAVGFSVSWSSTTLTMAGTGNSSSATGTAYYFR